MVIKFTDFYLFSGLLGGRNRLLGVERCNRQVELTNISPDGGCVAIPIVNPWVRSEPSYYNPLTIIHLQ